MLALVIFRVLRQVFKGSNALARICNLLDKESHPYVFHCYYITAIFVFVAHAAVALLHGVELESGVTAAAASVELIAHLIAE